jgi:hypothetical protein
VHELLKSSDDVFMSFVEAMLKAEGIESERIPVTNAYGLGTPALYVDEDDAFRAKEVLKLAKAEQDRINDE